MLRSSGQGRFIAWVLYQILVSSFSGCSASSPLHGDERSRSAQKLSPYIMDGMRHTSLKALFTGHGVETAGGQLGELLQCLQNRWNIEINNRGSSDPLSMGYSVILQHSGYGSVVYLRCLAMVPTGHFSAWAKRRMSASFSLDIVIFRSHGCRQLSAMDATLLSQRLCLVFKG